MKGNKYIRVALVEGDNPGYGDVIEGPREVLDNIKQYLGIFYQYAEESYFGDWGDYDKTQHLVDFLNENFVIENVKIRLVERQTEDFGGYKVISI